MAASWCTGADAACRAEAKEGSRVALHYDCKVRWQHLQPDYSGLRLTVSVCTSGKVSRGPGLLDAASPSEHH